MSVRLANGLHMPEVGLGTFQASGPQLQAAVKAALCGNIMHVDSANMYGVRFMHALQAKGDDVDS